MSYEVNTTYLAVDKTVKNISDVPPYPTVSPFTVPFPSTHADIIANFKDHLRALPKTEGKKIVAVIDTIISNPGVLLPWKEMVEICRDYSVWSVVDAAHSIGQELDINLSESKPDFWVSVTPWLCPRE
jgi:hercynylcysteine S-oxide lyase